jgi:hypothetical protein
MLSLGELPRVPDRSTGGTGGARCTTVRASGPYLRYGYRRFAPYHVLVHSAHPYRVGPVDGSHAQRAIAVRSNLPKCGVFCMLSLGELPRVPDRSTISNTNEMDRSFVYLCAPLCPAAPLLRPRFLHAAARYRKCKKAWLSPGTTLATSHAAPTGTKRERSGPGQPEAHEHGGPVRKPRPHTVFTSTP